MTGFESKRKVARDKVEEDDDTQVYADTLLLVYQRGFADGKAAMASLNEITDMKNAENERLKAICRAVYEVWAGSEGIPVPETAAEGYLLMLVEAMRDEAKEGLK